MSGEFSDKQKDLRDRLIRAANAVTENYSFEDHDEDFQESIAQLRKAARRFNGQCEHCGGRPYTPPKEPGA